MCFQNYYVNYHFVSALQGIITEANVGPHEAYEMQIAIVQIYMAMVLIHLFFVL